MLRSLRRAASSSRGLGCALLRQPLCRALAVPADFDLLGEAAGGGLVRFDGADEAGFVLGGVRHNGAVLAYRELALSWTRVRALADVTPASLAPLLVLSPRPEVLVLGVPPPLPRPPPQLVAWLRGHGIALELQRRADAGATFNLLGAEGRRVAFGGLPP